ncbi:hypothetical protein KIN20_032962 [Parelaphostrongylus tenuis]|uniref:Uncharacterized protein n=1 Tax=Parelaphostrongylus tenuis TaxID=148309 RepID=A0AAD5R7T5_PARTN|nr:hypothetical protein KIN20_032962 [Parelaphostrongylus tenuis]
MRMNILLEVPFELCHNSQTGLHTTVTAQDVFALVEMKEYCNKKVKRYFTAKQYLRGLS